MPFLPQASRAAYVENTLIYEAQYEILMPRAVAFSAGVINHFFRGRLNLVKGTQSTEWKLVNKGKDLMDGTFEVYSENTIGIRAPISGAQWRKSLAVGDGNATTVNFSVPADTARLVAVFKGRIGTEGDPEGLGFYAVAGKVITYTSPLPEFPGVTRSPATMVAGQPFSVTYTAKNTTSGSYVCKNASGTVSSGVLYSGTNTITGTAMTAWTGSPMTCTYTVSGPGGTTTWQEPSVTTVMPALPCGTPFSAAGSSAGTSVTQELGSTAGNVWVNFWSYEIPDGLTVTTDNSSRTLLAETGGMVSGMRTLSFHHNPALRGTTKVRVTVTGNTDPNTAWAVRIGCPNQAAPGETPVNVTFKLDGPGAIMVCIFKYTLRVNGVLMPFPTTVSLLPSLRHSYSLMAELQSPSIPCKYALWPVIVDGGGTQNMFTNSNQFFNARGGYGGGGG